MVTSPWGLFLITDLQSIGQSCWSQLQNIPQISPSLPAPSPLPPGPSRPPPQGTCAPQSALKCDSRRALSNPRQSRPLLAQNFAVASRLSRSRGKGPDDIPGGPGLPHHSAPSAPSSSPHRCSAAQAPFPLRAFPSAVPSAWIALSGNISQTFLSLPQVFVLLLWFSH